MSSPVLAEPTARSGGKRRFLSEYVRSPLQVGAVAPSSRYLARRMLERVDFSRVKAVLEYGPGTGSFTGELLSRVHPGTRVIAIELNDTMSRVFAARYPGVTLHQRSVAEASEICISEGLPAEGGIDLIVSGLPWAAFSAELQHELLQATVKVLRPGGMMATFAYHTGLLLPTGKRFAALLPNYFSRVERSASVWWNLPPAFVYRCFK